MSERPKPTPHAWGPGAWQTARLHILERGVAPAFDALRYLGELDARFTTCDRCGVVCASVTLTIGGPRRVLFYGMDEDSLALMRAPRCEPLVRPEATHGGAA